MGSSIEKDLDELNACIGWSIGNVDAPVVVLEGEAKSPKSSSSRKELGFEADWAKGAPRLREGGRCRKENFLKAHVPGSTILSLPITNLS